MVVAPTTYGKNPLSKNLEYASKDPNKKPKEPPIDPYSIPVKKA